MSTASNSAVIMPSQDAVVGQTAAVSEELMKKSVTPAILKVVGESVGRAVRSLGYKRYYVFAVGGVIIYCIV